MLRRITLAAIAAVAFAMPGAGSAEASCSNIAAGAAGDGGYGIVLSSYVSGCANGNLQRQWKVWRWQDTSGGRCDTGDTCKWTVIWAPWYYTGQGQYNVTINCWSAQYAFIGTTQFAVDFYVGDGSPIQGPFRTQPSVFTAC